MSNERTLSSDEQSQVERYISEVAARLGYSLQSLSPMVRGQIDRCGQHGFSVEQAEWSVREWLEGNDGT